MVPLLDRRAGRLVRPLRAPAGEPPRPRRTTPDELSHYSSATSDIEYLYPIGWSELEGIANRGTFDLTAHAEASGTTLEWVDGGSGERYVPAVIEPAAGVNRAMLAFLCDAYDEEVVGDRERTVLRLHPEIAPVKVAVLPLIPRDAGIAERARALHQELRRVMVAEHDDGGQIGRRYRRQDEIGTPWALTVDEQTLVDETVTIRDRDTLAQERISISRAREHLLDRLAAPWAPPARALAPEVLEDTITPRMGASLIIPRSRRWAICFRTRVFSRLDELERVAAEISARRDIWEPLVRVDPDQRRYELVYEDDHVDAWVLSWMPGQGTGFHDHYISGVGLCCAQGGVREDLLVYGAPDVELHLRAGDTRRGGPGYIHRVRHEEGEPAVTIHVYSPRLDWVGQYRLGDNGLVRREVRPGRNELTDQLISEGALQHVLERF